LMGGEISVSSQPGKGSTFGFTMKYRDATAEEVQELSLGTVHSTVQNDEKISVLVAEDNEYNFMVTRDTILKYYPSGSVHRAVDGSEAVSMVGSGSFSLVLMDVQMPLMDGYEATRQIRASQSDVPIYGLTASVIRSDLDRCVEAGMDGYLAKPFREKDLLRIIQQATNTSGVVTHTPLAGDSEKIKQRFLKFMPARIELLNSALHEKDHEGIQRLVHMIRPQLVRSGLAHLDPICIEIETSDPPFSTIEPKVQVILDSIRKHLDKLRNEAP